ncbi:type I restriction-modification system subunit M N-terminal domain-containing protein [Bradyrhizobium sp. LB11.1]|uniref:type I restriction-modification system subunit M N-terminal domain-containing protein n=1 Tax=Bradyrhizobium sp. LB11.1 TaxID=3156326 RepID=UPI003394E612
MARGSGKSRGAKVDRGTESNGNGAFEAKLWAAADALRNNMDAAEYKHVVLGLIFLKYISDAFEAKHGELDAHARRAPIRRTRTSIAPRTSSGCRRKHGGAISSRWRRSRPSASSSTTP